MKLEGKKRLGCVLAVVVATASCGLFEDLSPKNIAFRMSGSAGLQAEVIYSTDFVAGVDFDGVTHVQIFQSDTVFHTLPIDTVMSIAQDQRWFVHVTPMGSDTLAVTVVVNVDDRNLVAESGGIFPGMPWRYVYVFNEALTEVLDVTF